MIIYFSETEHDNSYFGDNTPNYVQLSIVSVNYQAPEADFKIDVPDNEFNSFAGYDIIETLKRLQIIKEQPYNSILIADKQLPLYREEL